MKEYLLIVLITFASCVKRMIIDKSNLVESTAPCESKSQEDIYFTICVDLIHNPDYLEILKEYLEEVPDNMNEMDVCYEVIEKLSTEENFDEIIDQFRKEENNIVVYSLPKSSAINKDLVPMKQAVIDDKYVKDRPLLIYDDELILQWPWKINWKKLWNAFVDVVEAFIPPLDPYLDRFKFKDQ